MPQGKISKSANRRMDANVCRQHPMFASLDSGQIDGIFRVCPVLSLSAGKMIFSAGEKADAFFVLLAGRVNIFQLSAGGDQQILHTITPGQSFADAAMWAGQNYPACAETTESSRLLAIRRDALRKLIAQKPELAMGMMAGMSAKLREFVAMIENLSLKDVPSRLASYILSEVPAGGGELKLSQTKRELAARLGTVPETLSRAFAKLKSAGAIRLTGGQIKVLDMSKLRVLAGID